MYATEEVSQKNKKQKKTQADLGTVGEQSGRYEPSWPPAIGWTSSVTNYLLTHHELLNTDGEGCRVEQDLPVLGQEADDVLDEHHKILREQFVRLRTGAERAVKRTDGSRFTF